MATTKRGKIMVAVSAIIFVFLIGAAVFVSIESREENRKFLAEGVRVTGTVLSLDESGNRKNRSYSMMISMFVKGPVEKTESKDTGHKSQSERIIDSVFENAKSIIGANDSFQTVHVNISSATFYAHKVGDMVEVVYLKENPKEIKLVEEIDGL